MIRMNAGSISTVDCDHQKFQLWWRKFKDYGYLDGFGNAINDKRDPNLQTLRATPLDTNTKTAQLQMKAKKQNKAAITMAFVKEGIMGQSQENSHEE
jgi:hypothetical protein